jgi:uncharacterized cupredoxin-like copper-binding protein
MGFPIAVLRRMGLLVMGWLMGWLCLSGGILQAEAIASPANLNMTTDVTVQLGTPDGELVFVPAHLEFSAGHRYRLQLENPSSTKHYFTAKDFADNIWTQKVQAAGVEVKGAIHELELQPGAVAEWVFVPQKPGTYNLRCIIAGHTAAGMTGELTIAP